MASERKFILKAISDFRLKEFLEQELSAAGVSHIEIQRTPIATRIAIFVRRPGLVVGKKGKTIKDITDALQATYGVENPQMEVVEVPNPSLDAKLMAEKIGRQLEIKGNTKTAMRFALREIMSAGAIGGEIKAAGKLVGKGAKAKHVNMRAGYLKKSGEQAKKVHIGKFTAHMKSGTIGIVVKIVQPGTKFSDVIDISNLKLPGDESISSAVIVQQAKPAEEKKKFSTTTATKKRAPRKKAKATENAQAPAAQESVQPPVATVPSALPSVSPAPAVE